MLFADFVRSIRAERAGEAALHDPAIIATLDRTPAFRFYVLWLTFPPMLLLLLGQPFALIIAYGAFGAFFMPFLALTLMWLLNSKLGLVVQPHARLGLAAFRCPLYRPDPLAAVILLTVLLRRQEPRAPKHETSCIRRRARESLGIPPRPR